MLYKISVPIIFLCFVAATASAQTSYGEQTKDIHGMNICSWDEFVEKFASSYFDDNEVSISEERMDQLRAMHDNPMDINTASRDKLLDLPFISPFQADAIINYISRYGPVLSLGELSLIPRLDYRTRYFLTAFVIVSPPSPPTLSPKKTFHEGRHNLALNISIPLYTAEGYKNNTLSENSKYTGGKNHTAFRYSYNYNEELKYGLGAEKDAGEPFACRGNTLFDSYTFHVFRKQKNGKYCFAIGDFRVNLGEGLTVGNMYFSGKKSVLSNYYNYRSTFIPHTSNSERDYFRGAGGNIRIGKFLATAFASYKSNDAIINDSGKVTSVSNTGYHRTIPEQKRKGDLRDMTFGGDFSYDRHNLKIGISSVYVCYDKALAPRKAEYNRYAMRGKNFHSYALHCQVNLRSLTSRGECAISETNAISAINTVKWRISNKATLVNILRSYSMRYRQPYAESFGSSGKVSNEQGVYIGGTYDFTNTFTLQGYADVYHCPWPSYKYRAPVDGTEFFIGANLHNNKGDFVSAELKAGHKNINAIRLTKDSADKTKCLARLQAVKTLGKTVSRTTLSFASSTDKDKTSNGWAISQRLDFPLDKLKIHASASYFNTGDYSSRIYTYENCVKHYYNNFAALYGNGIRAYLLCSGEIGKNIRLYAKYGFTRYFDRKSIGSGAQQIKSSSKNDLNFCIDITI